MSEPAQPALAPFLRWAGGKTKLLPELMARMPKTFGRYYEPFCGGAALFFALAPTDAIIGDLNEHLIGAYRALVYDVEAVIAALEVHAKNHRASWYSQVRDSLNAGLIKGEVNKAAATIYQNRVCFNGLHRVDSVGWYNVPMGDRQASDVLDAGALRAASVALSKATIMCLDYRGSMDTAKRGDVAYIDPPYDTDGGFTAFTSDGFGAFAQTQLAEQARRLRDRGVFVMLSNSDTPLIRQLYSDWTIDRVSRPGTMNSDIKNRGRVAEVIITPTT